MKMKKTFFLLVIFLSITISAQTKIIDNLASFEELEVTSGIEVILVKSNENKLEIEGKKAEAILANVTNGLLKIGLPFSKKAEENLVNGKAIATLFYKENLTKITADNNTVIKGKDIKQTYLNCLVKERGIIELDIIVDEIKVTATSGGIITLKGSAKNQNVIVELYGVYEGFELKVSGDSFVSAKSGAKAEIYTEEKLTPIVGFGGSIFYKGNPQIGDDKKINGGIVQKRD